jgi:hypothetical protein
MDPYHMCKLSVSGVIDESRVSAATALNRRDPVVLEQSRIHELIAEKKKKKLRLSPTLEPYCGTYDHNINHEKGPSESSLTGRR